jgi:two-component system, cell cycle response regulator
MGEYDSIFGSLRPKVAEGPPVILVVDDDAATRMLIRRWLERSDLQVVEAQDGIEGLDMIRSEGDRLSAVLLDVMMPRMDGYEVLRKLHGAPEADGLPIVLLTAHANAEEDVVKSIEHGATDHLAKPFRGPVLVAKVKALCEQRRASAAMQGRLQQAVEQATTDPLTGLANRRDFERWLRRELAYTERHREPVALLMLDLDHFKSVNDTYGHPEGDRVLVATADAIRLTLRTSDLAFRLGGEEFGVILRGCDAAQAIRAGERLVEAQRREPFAFAGGDTKVLTMSVGAAAADQANGFFTEDIVGRADQALYRAKRTGRNQVVLEEAQIPRTKDVATG